MSIAYEINRLKQNKQEVKEQVNIDKDIISEGREFISGETVSRYPSRIKIMEMSYKDFIPVHTSTESLIETERGGTIIERHLMGNTTQNGTPTPDAPVVVNNVTGEQVVRVCGKNLFDKSTATLGKGVNTSNGNLYNDSSLFATDFIEVKTGGVYYTTSGYSTSANRVYGAQYDSNKQYIASIATNAENKTFYISNASTKYIRLTGFISDIDTYQLEERKSSNNL